MFYYTHTYHTHSRRDQCTDKFPHQYIMRVHTPTPSTISGCVFLSSLLFLWNAKDKLVRVWSSLNIQLCKLDGQCPNSPKKRIALVSTLRMRACVLVRWRRFGAVHVCVRLLVWRTQRLLCIVIACKQIGQICSRLKMEFYCLPDRFDCISSMWIRS